MHREIELFGHRVVVPEHERFELYNETECFLTDTFDLYPIDFIAHAEGQYKPAFESCCCIAIEYWSTKLELSDDLDGYYHPDTYARATDEEMGQFYFNRGQVHAWRSVLAAAKSGGGSTG